MKITLCVRFFNKVIGVHNSFVSLLLKLKFHKTCLRLVADGILYLGTVPHLHYTPISQEGEHMGMGMIVPKSMI